MKNVIRRLVGAFVVVGSLLGSQLFAGPAGDWSGFIELPNGQELAIGVELRGTESGDWEGLISIPVQGIRDFELSDVSVNASDVEFAMEGIPGKPRFEGTLSQDEQKLNGSFYQGGQALRFSLSREHGKEGKSESAVALEGIPGEGIVGEWMGTLDAGPMKLRLALHLTEDESGEFAGTLDSLDQGVDGLVLSEIVYGERRLAFRVRRVGGRFSGALNESGAVVKGEWEQNGQKLPLNFLRTETPVTLNRPQLPQPPFPYENKEVNFRNDESGIQLSGTLVLPEGRAPFPAVVFLSGSGPQDRDEAIAGHRPFAVLADALARCGIASLRYDDRGVGKSEGSYMDSTLNDFANDALAAIRFLRTYPEIDTNWIGIVGHSEGGLVGPIAATLGDEVDYLVLLAPPVERLDELLIRQKSAILGQLGIEADLVRQLEQESREEMELILDESLSNEAIEEAFSKRYDRYEQDYGRELLQKIGLSRDVVAVSVKTMRSSWFLDLMQTDPAKYLRELKQPVLALFGEKDVQVDAEVNSRLLKQIFGEAAGSEIQVKVLSNLNHLFQNSNTGSIQEYSAIEETFDPVAMRMICDWIGELRR